MIKIHLATIALMMGSASAMASCPNITYDQLTTALKTVVKSTTFTGAPTGGPSANTNGGLDFDMWATVVGTDGTVCLVTKTGAGANNQWLISRVISAQKANTALGLSTNSFALSTANLYSAVQPNGSLFGLQHSNPVDTSVGTAATPPTLARPSTPCADAKSAESTSLAVAWRSIAAANWSAVWESAVTPLAPTTTSPGVHANFCLGFPQPTFRPELAHPRTILSIWLSPNRLRLLHPPNPLMVSSILGAVMQPKQLPRVFNT